MSSKRSGSPRFINLKPKSRKASDLARASSKKTNTRCELLLRKALKERRLSYSLHAEDMPGCPDVIFRSERVAVFVDGDFWHGHNLRARLSKLSKGHNGSYWVNKILSNVRRDRRNTSLLKRHGWGVIRVWESDLYRDSESMALIVADTVQRRRRRKKIIRN